MDKKEEKVTFGMGCFWCSEAIFQKLKGVNHYQSGYSGGKIASPTYREVCSGLTDHAEVLQISYNSDEISFEQLLAVFFKTHDPTTLNRQGGDIGTQYRSVIFYHNKEQKEKAEKAIEALNKMKAFSNPIVTELSPFKAFYPAEEEHKNYYREHGDAAYCRVVIQPKISKLNQYFNELIAK